jgi:hypothetical protein
LKVINDLVLAPSGCLTPRQTGRLTVGRTITSTLILDTSSLLVQWEFDSDRLCGLVVWVLGYRSGGPGSIPGTTRKKIMGLKRGPLSLVSTTEELLDRKVAAPVYKIENTAVGIRHADHVAPSIRKKVGNHFADKRRSLGWCSSLAESDHWV